MQDHVVLTDAKGKIIGTEDKLIAHQKGLLHLAFSIFIFNDKGEMLLQQRALNKYHFAGIWSNTCCSHPRLNENIADAAQRRLQEELGFVVPLKSAFHFTYRAQDPQSMLIEHELDTVFLGIYNPIDPIPFNTNEIAALRWIDLSTLYLELSAEPEKFSYWFKIALHELESKKLLSISKLKKWIEV
jgi:isopentenyl-diphosphate delta-isomerase